MPGPQKISVIAKQPAFYGETAQLCRLIKVGERITIANAKAYSSVWMEFVSEADEALYHKLDAEEKAAEAAKKAPKPAPAPVAPPAPPAPPVSKK